MRVQDFEKMALKDKISYVYEHGIWIKSLCGCTQYALAINKLQDFYVQVYLRKPVFKIEQIVPVLPNPNQKEFVPVGKLL